jgi:hypothetical protein
MMEKILLVTVGGSPKPIITAVESLQPDRVIFLIITDLGEAPFFLLTTH